MAAAATVLGVLLAAMPKFFNLNTQGGGGPQNVVAEAKVKAETGQQVCGLDGSVFLHFLHFLETLSNLLL